jgi:ribosomal protein L11 methyltransferase
MPPDRWLVLTVRLPPEARGEPSADLLPDLLLGLGGRGVEETGSEFTTYLLPPEDLEAFLDAARSAVDAAAPPGTDLCWSWRPQEDWEYLWRRGLGPRRITDRLVVAPTWDVPMVGREDVLIRLDPGMAFGTAEHATTRGCLRLLASRVREGDRIADVGSGSGILSIAAARLGAAEVIALEADPVACEVAEENVAANGVRDRVKVRVEEVDGSGPLTGFPFSGILANIQSLVLLGLLPVFRASLAEGGWLILSGLQSEEREDFLSAASDRGFVLEEEDLEESWWSGAFT